MNIYPFAFTEHHFIQPIMDNQASKVVQFSFPKGKILEKHKTSSPILVLVVFGQVWFKANEEVLLQACQLVSLEPNVEHSIEALEDSLILLILTPSPSAHTIFRPSEADPHTLDPEASQFIVPQQQQQVLRNVL